MSDAKPRWLRSEFLSGMAGISLAATVVIALIALFSGLRAEAAPVASKSDLALFDPGQGLWHLRYGDSTVETFYFGIPGDRPLLGDWDCDGIDTVALFRPSSGYVYLRNTNSAGEAEMSFFYGIPGDVALVGDWDGDGCDTLGVQREGQFFLTDQLGTGVANSRFSYGLPGDVPFAGDFNGNGKDTIGLHRTSAGQVLLSNANPDGQVGETVKQFRFGLVSDLIVASDWDADGIDSVGVYRQSENRFYLPFEQGPDFSDDLIIPGQGGWIPLAGNFG